MIEVTEVQYTYGHESHDTPAAVGGVTLTFAPGQTMALLGENGSGKSTLARLLAGILVPQSGAIVVDGVSVNDRARRWEARRMVGLVLQNPDDQLITTTLVEEVAFGPENLGLPRDVIRRNVDDAITLMGLTPFVTTPLNELSLGQRQRVAIAGVLAMEPRYIIFDEPSSMLPSPLVGQVLETVKRLAHERNIGAIWITHHMDEAVEMDRVVVMSHGAVALDGAPRETLTQVDRLRALRLDAPPAVLLAQRLRARGYPIRPDTLTPEEFCAQARPFARPLVSAKPHVETPSPPAEPNASGASSKNGEPPLLETRNLSYTHLSGTPFAQQALNGLTSHIPAGALVAFVGPTRSGKSTLLDCFNAIIKPGRGMVYYEGRDASAPGFDVEALRRAVSIVYQSPDSQILEDVVGKDVAFSLIRRKTPLAESRKIVQESLEAVGLPYEDFRNRYTYALSGGEKRRVAIAGALASAPEALILDEPMAGLDPIGREEFVRLLQRLRSHRAMTVVYLTASLDDVTNLADYIYVLDAGSVALDGPPMAIRRHASALERLGVGLSAVTRLALALVEVTPGLDTACADLDALEAELVACLRSAPQAPASEQEALP